MTTLVLVIHIIIAAALVGIILIQRSEGGGLGLGSGGGGGLMSTRGTANLLTRTTGILAGLFFTTTIVLALLFKGAHKPKSILENMDKAPVAQEQSASEPAPAEAKPDVKANEAAAPTVAPEAKHAPVKDTPPKAAKSAKPKTDAKKAAQ